MKILILFNIKFKQEISKLKRVLDYNGFRAFNSNTYIGELNSEQLAILKSEISKISKDEDTVLLIPICKSCFDKIEIFGKEILFEEEKYKIL